VVEKRGRKESLPSLVTAENMKKSRRQLIGLTKVKEEKTILLTTKNAAKGEVLGKFKWSRLVFFGSTEENRQDHRLTFKRKNI